MQSVFKYTEIVDSLLLSNINNNLKIIYAIQGKRDEKTLKNE